MALEDVQTAIRAGDKRRAADSARAIKPDELTGTAADEAVYSALLVAEQDFVRGQISLPRLMKSAEAAKAVMRETGRELPPLGKAAVCTMDSHTDGRNLMALLLGIAGVECTIVEGGAMPDDIAVIVEKDPEIAILCASGEFASVGTVLRSIVKELEKRGVRDRVVMNAGGVPVSRELAKKTGMDVWAPTAPEAVRGVIVRVLEKKGHYDKIRRMAGCREEDVGRRQPPPRRSFERKRLTLSYRFSCRSRISCRPSCPFS